MRPQEDNLKMVAKEIYQLQTTQSFVTRYQNLKDNHKDLYGQFNKLAVTSDILNTFEINPKDNEDVMKTKVETGFAKLSPEDKRNLEPENFSYMNTQLLRFEKARGLDLSAPPLPPRASKMEGDDYQRARTAAQRDLKAQNAEIRKTAEPPAPEATQSPGNSPRR